MNWIRRYMLSIMVAAIICAILKGLINKNRGSGKLIKLLAGIFLTITVIMPWNNFKISDIPDYIQDFSAEAEAAAEVGNQYRRNELQQIIKSQTEAYILNKAESLGVELRADVRVSEGDPPVPCAVILDTTTLAPYRKEQLKAYIANELGISEDQQTWG